ncbi:trans-sulfuration enzyme family protein [Cognatishimia maritima]|uniref:Cystathionine gamma-synthase n=1 Tax=Cognatishimia maritima TaxID=870908 RepID=A0A1M5NGT0_9RHOB|nr:aminotransferase class V-fold PLP-dependent enzyme [Cognatishimia maritima]SHG88796.1 cystathionine gamma-synthase [Cognatishimia maritima]
MEHDVKPATWVAHAGGAKDQSSGGVVPAIQPATTFYRDSDYGLHNPDNIYLRPHSENLRQAEAVIQKLEGAAETLLFPSGMAAIAAAFRWLPNGARVVLQDGIYWGTTKWIQAFCQRRGITLLTVDASDTEALAAICQDGVDLVFVETPSNPWLKIADIAKAAEAAHTNGGILVVDATAATPILSKPLALGADIVMHSATKALNGHSDVLGGVLSCREQGEIWEAIRTDRADSGAMLGPFEAWLLMRGMRTLALRVERMSENAQALATYFADHPAVEDVLYPGLPTHPAHALAKSQMTGGFGGLMSVLVKGDMQNALAVAGRLNLFVRATSLGGVESLVEHRYSVESHTGLPQNLLRLSVGIEDVQDLIDDFAQALGQ